MRQRRAVADLLLVGGLIATCAVAYLLISHEAAPCAYCGIAYVPDETRPYVTSLKATPQNVPPPDRGSSTEGRPL